MASKSKFVLKQVQGGSANTETFPVVPDGKVWVISTFGALDVNNGDNCSSAYLLKFGNKIIKAISVTGDTIELSSRYEVVGDGVKELSVIMQNNSAQNKNLCFWIDAYTLG